jgi:DNA-binding CsgD family transcriptional regulator
MLVISGPAPLSIRFVRQEFPAHHDIDAISFRIRLTGDADRKIDGAHDAVAKLFMDEFLDGGAVHVHDFIPAVESDVIACIAAGALGYLLKEEGLRDIGYAVRDIQRGGSPMSSSIIRKILIQSRNGEKEKMPVPEGDGDEIHFTNREISVLQLIARGCSYEEIAQALSISILTVQNYIKRLYRKLSVNSRGKAVFEAQRRGLLESRD